MAQKWIRQLGQWWSLTAISRMVRQPATWRSQQCSLGCGGIPISPLQKHISVLKTQCKEALNLIRVVAHLKWGGDRDTLLMLYRAIVRSKLDYGCIVYGTALNANLRQLDNIHNSGLRLALGAFSTSPVSSLYIIRDLHRIGLRGRLPVLSLNISGTAESESELGPHSLTNSTQRRVFQLVVSWLWHVLDWKSINRPPALPETFSQHYLLTYQSVFMGAPWTP